MHSAPMYIKKLWILPTPEWWAIERDNFKIVSRFLLYTYCTIFFIFRSLWHAPIFKRTDAFVTWGLLLLKHVCNLFKNAFKTYQF